MTQTFIITGRLPSRNEAEYAARSHYMTGAKYKREFTDLVFFEAKRQRIRAVEGKALIGIKFYEKDERRDADNVIGGGIKYILDGLVQAGIIKNDTRRYVNLYIEPIATDRDNPRITITIEEATKNGNQT